MRIVNILIDIEISGNATLHCVVTQLILCYVFTIL